VVDDQNRDGTNRHGLVPPGCGRAGGARRLRASTGKTYAAALTL
jgi:hypothetical protein